MPKLRMKSVRSFVVSVAKLDSRRVFQTPVICDTIEPVYAGSPDPADDKEKMNEYPI